MKIFSLDICRAKKGDCLLLHYGEKDGEDRRLALIDGGPAGVYREHLKPRLKLLSKQRPAPDERLLIDLLMVSHIDDDHIHGILDLANELSDPDEEPWATVANFWHNTFDKIAAVPSPKTTASITASLGGSEARKSPDEQVAKILASVPQGIKLQTRADGLHWENNQFGGDPIMDQKGESLDMGDGLEFIVLGPMKAELDALREEHEKFLAKKADAKSAASLAAYTDQSVANLSSIVVLAKFEKKSILFTGDARGDRILEGLGAANLLDNGQLHVNILKVPHHGSDRNMKTCFFEKVTADHYVFSGDGEHGNPERETLKMLLDARGDAKFTVHLTYPVDEIDPIRKQVWKEEQEKERKRKAKAEEKAKTAPPDKPVKIPKIREDWSDEEHSLKAFLTANPEFAKKIKVVGDGEAHVIDLLDPLGY